MAAMQRFLAICLFLPWSLIPAIYAQADPVDDYLHTEMLARKIPGLALAVVQDGRVAKRADYGLANLELKVPVQSNTVFEIGSLTKQLTAAAILLLIEEGLIELDAPIHTYLEGTPETWHEITVRHLLTHTSGLKSYTGMAGFELRRHLTQEQFIAATSACPLEFRPGDSWKYCNTGYNLLGFIIENVSRKGYWQFMAERIFGPLQMSSTTNRLPSQVILNRAAGYEQTNHVLINRDYDLTDVFSAGAAVSTVADLVRWNLSLENGTLLNAKSRREMWAPARLRDGTLTHYGFGWRLDVVEGHADVGHGGSTSGFSASLQRFPEDKLAVIILTNTDEQIAPELAKRVARFYFRARRP